MHQGYRTTPRELSSSGAPFRTRRVILLLSLLAALLLPARGFANLPLRDVLRADGRIDLDALRHTG